MALFTIDAKTIKHFDVPGHAHLLTFSCVQRWQLLNRDDRRTFLSRRIDWATQHHKYRLIAFVYMPEHVHLLVFADVDCSTIDKFIYAVKKPFSDEVKRRLAAAHDPTLDQLTIRERPGRTSFRFWQEGPGHDRNILSQEAAIKAAEYIHNNPVRRKLCAQPDLWRWSSWKYYHQPERWRDAALPKVHGFPG